MTGSWFDRLPLPLQHLLTVVGAAFLAALGQAILREGGITGIHWAAVLDATAVTVAAGGVVLAGTPLTRGYGVGSRPKVGRHQAADGNGETGSSAETAG